MSSKPLVARQGDLLVVSYPEVRIPVAPYATVGVGNLQYTRVLAAGENTQTEYDSIYAFLKENAEKDAVVKTATWAAELNAKPKERPALPPKPAGSGAAPVSGTRPNLARKP